MNPNLKTLKKQVKKILPFNKKNKRRIITIDIDEWNKNVEFDEETLYDFKTYDLYSVINLEI